MAEPLGGLLLDIDGVLVESWSAIPGAGDAVRWLRAMQLPFRLVSNISTHSRARLAERLADIGIDVEADEIVTASRATAELVRTRYPGARVFLIAQGDAAGEFDGIELVEEAADLVVVGGLAENDPFPYEELNHAFAMVLDGAELVAMHRTLWWRTVGGPRLDSVAVVPAIEEAAGTRATVVGKPSRDFFLQALAQLGLEPARVAMVGDDVEADVRGAQALGMRGILVRTGKFREEDLLRAAPPPDRVVGSIAELPRVLQTLTAD